VTVKYLLLNVLHTESTHVASKMRIY
jgi:hypothetical protein